MAGIAVGMLGGLILALVRAGAVPIAATAVAVYVSVIRATPMVTLALRDSFFGLPALGLAMSPWAAAIVIIAINTSVFQAEIGGPRSWIFRGGSSTPRTPGV